MNTPTPVPRDPTTPGPSPPPTALNSALTATATGVPAGFVFVWLLETYGTVHGQPIKLDSTTAAMLGAALSGPAGYLATVVHALITALLDKLAEPPAK